MTNESSITSGSVDSKLSKIEKEEAIKIEIANINDLLACRGRFFWKLKEEFDRTSEEIMMLNKKKWALERQIIPIKICKPHVLQEERLVTINCKKTSKNVSYTKLTEHQIESLMNLLTGKEKTKK